MPLRLDECGRWLLPQEMSLQVVPAALLVPLIRQT